MSNSNLFLVAAAKRREKGISLNQIATITKISIRSLQAIEDREFRKLPGGIYNTSYIRQYARVIDVDERELLAVYYEESTSLRKEAATGFTSSLPG